MRPSLQDKQEPTGDESQRFKRLELLETLADHLGIGAVLLGAKGDAELQTRQIDRFETILGEGWYRPCIQPSDEVQELDLTDERQNRYSFEITRLTLFRQHDVVMIREVVESKEAKQVVEDAESPVSLFLDHLPASVFIKDDQRRVLYVNEYVKANFVPGQSRDTDPCKHFSAELKESVVRDDRRALSEGRQDLVERWKDRTGKERTFRSLRFVIPRPKEQPSLLGCIAWDISDALAASESLSRSKRRYREIFEIAEEGIWLVDADGGTVEVNQRMAQMLGYGVEEMRGRQLFDFMDEQARAEAEVLLDRCRIGVSEKYDFRFRTRVGGELWTMVSSAPMYDEMGSYAGALGMVTDITERKRAEDALRDHEAQLQLILASTGEGIFGVNMKGRCTFANRACIELLGFKDEADLLGKRIHWLVHHTRHDGTDYPLRECPTYRSCTSRHVTFADDELLWRADGTAFHAEYQSFPMVRDDSVIGSVVSFADITERKRAEADLKRERDFAESLIETAPVVVLVLDSEGKILRFNSFMEKLSGYPLAEVMGKSWFETFLPKRDIPRATRAFEKARNGVQTHGNTKAILTRDGKERLIAWYDMILRDGTGELGAVLAIGHDVTEQKAKEAQLVQAQKMETVGQLTGGIAHDFNNLLTVILGNLELLTRSIGPDPDTELFDLMQDSLSAAQDGAELTKRLLAFSRKAPLKRKWIDLRAFLSHFQRFLRRTLGSGVAISVDVEADFGYLPCDPHQLENALLNLALNARDAMPEGGRIRIRARSKQAADLDPTLEPGKYAELSVIDTGTGMNAEQLSRAIEPFYTTKGTKQGSGLGLSMVFGFCEQAGGIFRLASDPETGARAMIVLPFDGVNVQEGEPIRDSIPGILRGKGTVLVVEDDERIRKLAGRYLRDLGYDLLMAENGERAIEALQSDSVIELVFSDIVMPGEVNGDDLYLWVKAHRPEVKVLLTTGLRSAEIRALADDSEPPVPIGLPKPYTKEQLAEAIRDVFAG